MLKIKMTGIRLQVNLKDNPLVDGLPMYQVFYHLKEKEAPTLVFNEESLETGKSYKAKLIDSEGREEEVLVISGGRDYDNSEKQFCLDTEKGVLFNYSSTLEFQRD